MTLSSSAEERLDRCWPADWLIFVDDLPKTRSMKIMRRVVRAIVIGEAPGDLSSLANPEAVDSLRRSLEA